MRLNARRAQFQHVISDLDASQVMADLYQMQDLVAGGTASLPLPLSLCPLHLALHLPLKRVSLRVYTCNLGQGVVLRVNPQLKLKTEKAEAIACCVPETLQIRTHC